jgi:hypothetical protein
MTMIGETLLADGWLPFAMAEMIYARGPPDPWRTRPKRSQGNDMSSPFVGRTELSQAIEAILTSERPGPIVISGEPGMGRTRFLSRLVGQLDTERNAVFVLGKGPGPLAALRTHLPPDFTMEPASTAVIARAAAVITERAGARRPMLVADDVHLTDHATMQVVRQLHREAGAVVLVTQVTNADRPPKPDPLDCLRYEPGLRSFTLPPLAAEEVGLVLNNVAGGQVKGATVAAVHAATGGVPGLLSDLLSDGLLVSAMVDQDGLYQLSERPGQRITLSDSGTERLLSAVDAAWRDLSFDRLTELCKLGLYTGTDADVAQAWAFVLLLRGRAEDGIRFLDGLHQPDTQLASMSRALLLALGRGQVDEAGTLLDAASRVHFGHWLTGARAWLFAATGRPADAMAALRKLSSEQDRKTALFVHATKAVVALADNAPASAVPHLRRAVILAERLRDTLPWMAPYLTACLIDALLLTGRISEATSAAADFHAAQEGCGWDVTVALSGLMTARTTAGASHRST